MARPHDALMEACAAYASAVLPPTADYAATPIETGDGDSRLAERRKAQGSRRGEPDGRLLWQARYHGTEYKATRSDTLRPEQIARHAEIRAAGGTVTVIRTVVEFDALIRSLGIPLRHTSLTPEFRDMAWRAKVAMQRSRQAATRALSRQADAEVGVEYSPKSKRPSNPRAAKPTKAQIAAGNRWSLAMAGRGGDARS